MEEDVTVWDAITLLIAMLIASFIYIRNYKFYFNSLHNDIEMG